MKKGITLLLLAYFILITIILSGCTGRDISEGTSGHAIIEENDDFKITEDFEEDTILSWEWSSSNNVDFSIQISEDEKIKEADINSDNGEMVVKKSETCVIKWFNYNSHSITLDYSIIYNPNAQGRLSCCGSLVIIFGILILMGTFGSVIHAHKRKLK